MLLSGNDAVVTLVLGKRTTLFEPGQVGRKVDAVDGHRVLVVEVHEVVVHAAEAAAADGVSDEGRNDAWFKSVSFFFFIAINEKRRENDIPFQM